MPRDIIFNEAKGPESLNIIDSPIPIPKGNEVVIKMKAAGLNRSEYMFLTNTYVFEPSFPSRIGTEGSGIIYSKGKDIENFKEGDEVCIIPNILPYEYGVIGEYVLIPEDALIHKPSSMTFEESASVWMSLSTAYYGLVIKGGLSLNTNQIVLISAASSSIGVAAIQISKNLGATVIATSRTHKKSAFLKEMGADYVVATDSEDLAEKVNEFTKGKGFDIGFDMVAGDMITKFTEAAAPNATIIPCGLLSMQIPELPFLPMVMKNLTMKSFHVVLHLFRNKTQLNQAVDHILEGIDLGIYSAQIDKVFQFEKVKDAYNYMANSEQKGKIVIQFN